MVKQNFIFGQKVQYFFGKTAGAGVPRRSRGSPCTYVRIGCASCNRTAHGSVLRVWGRAPRA